MKFGACKKAEKKIVQRAFDDFSSYAFKQEKGIEKAWYKPVSSISVFGYNEIGVSGARPSSY